MAYTEFSTKKADYVLQLSSHYKENKQVDIFEGIDALVIETGRSSLEELLILGHPQLDIAIKYCEENNLPIFGTDVRSSRGGFLRSMFSYILGILACPIPLHYDFSNKKVNRLLGKLYSSCSFALQTPIEEARNAVNARKIEEFVIGKVKEIIVKKKPKVGLIFGTTHMGLEQDLRSKLRRNITLWNHKNLNFKRYSGLDRRELNKVYEGRFDESFWHVKEHTWQVKEHTVNLFKVK